MKLRDKITLSGLGQLVKHAQANKLLTPDQLAECLGLSPQQVRTLAGDGKIPSQRLGRQFAFNSLDVVTWLIERKGAQLELTPHRSPAPASEADRKEALRFIDSFGQEGAVWYAEGKTYEEAEALFLEAHADELADLRMKLGSQALARYALANRLPKKGSGKGARLAELNKKVDAKLAELGGNRRRGR